MKTTYTNSTQAIFEDFLDTIKTSQRPLLQDYLNYINQIDTASEVVKFQDLVKDALPEYFTRLQDKPPYVIAA